MGRIDHPSQRPNRLGALLLAGLSILLITGTACGQGESVRSFQRLSQDLEYQLELVTDRQLSRAEIERATREYHALFDNHCSAACIENIELNTQRVEPMKTRRGEPADLLARQYYSRTLYFSPTQAGSFIQQLSNELDPIQVADAKSSRIMTNKDVLAVMNINHFLTEGGKPIEQSFGQDRIDERIRFFRQEYVDGYRSLPFRMGLAAELWAGLQQNWDSLNADQRDQVIAYFKNEDWTFKMDQRTYEVLLALTAEEASEWRNTDLLEQQYAQLNLISEIQLMGHAVAISNNSMGFWRW